MTKKPAIIAAACAVAALVGIVGQPSGQEVADAPGREGAEAAAQPSVAPVQDGEGIHVPDDVTASGPPPLAASEADAPGPVDPTSPPSDPTSPPAEPSREEADEAAPVQEEQGVFYVHCGFSHSLHDDPIVHPLRPGASHRHDFFGNVSTNANSTHPTMQRADTTCARKGDTAGYWTPSLYVAGTRVEPRKAMLVYSAGRKDPSSIEAPPADLRVIASEPHAGWRCRGTGENRVPDTPVCASAEMLWVSIGFPDCWDGVLPDSPDHRSRMAYSEGGACPSGHPVPLPAIKLQVQYRTSGGQDVVFAPRDDPSEAHADFWNTWDQDRLARLVRNCINASVNCGSRGIGES